MTFTFAHNNFNVLDLDKSLAFYKEALGLTEVRRINAKDESFIIVYLGDAAGSAYALELTWLRDWDHPYDLCAASNSTSLSPWMTLMPHTPVIRKWAASALKMKQWASTSLKIRTVTGWRFCPAGADFDNTSKSLSNNKLFLLFIDGQVRILLSNMLLTLSCVLRERCQYGFCSMGIHGVHLPLPHRMSGRQFLFVQEETKWKHVSPS